MVSKKFIYDNLICDPEVIDFFHKQYNIKIHTLDMSSTNIIVFYTEDGKEENSEMREFVIKYVTLEQSRAYTINNIVTNG